MFKEWKSFMKLKLLILFSNAVIYIYATSCCFHPTFFFTNTYGGEDRLGSIYSINSYGQLKNLYNFTASSSIYYPVGLIEGYNLVSYGTALGSTQICQTKVGGKTELKKCILKE